MTEPNSAVVIVIVPLLSDFGEECKKVSILRSLVLVEINSHEQTFIKQGFVGCWIMDELGLVSISRWRKSGTYSCTENKKERRRYKSDPQPYWTQGLVNATGRTFALKTN